MPLNMTSTLDSNRSPRPYGATSPGFAFTRSYTSANLLQDFSNRSGGGGLKPSMSSASLAQGGFNKPISKSPSSSFLRETPRNGGISRPTSLLFEPSLNSLSSSKATTPTKPLYSPIAGNTRSLVSALNSLGKGETNSNLQNILGKKKTFAEEAKQKSPLYIPRHGGVSSYAKAYMDKAKTGHVEWPKRQNKPREIDTRDINLNKDKPPAPVAKPGSHSSTPYRDNSVTRNRSVVRITSRRKKSVKDTAPKTIGQKLMEKYVERDKDEKKEDAIELILRNRRWDTSNHIPPSDKLPVDLNLPGPNLNLPLRQNESCDNPKQVSDIEIRAPAVDTSSSESDSDEQDDTFMRVHRATEAAANRKNLEDTQDIKDAIIAAILHPDVDIESDEEMQNLIADDSRSSNSSKGSVNMSTKRQSGKRRSKNNLVNIVENSVEQNNNVINTKDTDGKADGDAIVGQLKRFVKLQLSMKRSRKCSSPKTQLSEIDNESKPEHLNQPNQTNRSNILDNKNNNIVSRISGETTQISGEKTVSSSNEVHKSTETYIDRTDIPEITLKSPSNNEFNKNNITPLLPCGISANSDSENKIDKSVAYKDNVMIDTYKQSNNRCTSQDKEKYPEQHLENSKIDLKRDINEYKPNAITAATTGEPEGVAIEAPILVIKSGGKNCGVPWGEIAPGAPDIPVEPEWPPKNKAQQLPVKTNDKLKKERKQSDAKSTETETEKKVKGEKKAMKRPRQIVPPPKKEDGCVANILEARKILKRPVKQKEIQKNTTEEATDMASLEKTVLKKFIPSKDDDASAILGNQLKNMKKVLKTPGMAEERQKILIKKAAKNERRSSSSNEASSTKNNNGDTLKKGKGKNGDKSSNGVNISLQVIGSKETLSQSADSGYGSSPSTPQPTTGQTDVIEEEEISHVCGTNCHKKCEKQMPNLCGVNQKLLAEALSSVKKGSGGGQDSGLTPASGAKVGSLSDENDDDTETESDTADYFGSPEIRSPLQTRPKFKKYSLDDFNFVKVLGKGSYGKVMLAEQKGTENYFAIKCLKKDVVLEDNDVECTLIERKVLTLGTKHPYLCHLFCSFQTPSHLFFVMEYLTGGDLMFHIQHCGRFDEYRACFYAAEITSGLKFLHNKGIIYRDLKLDNILLDYQGHIRIADFGMCKLQIYLDRFADTFCGTPDYMAPEVIKGQHYNQCVDWWSFGVLLYEMLTGKSPFKGCDEDHLFWLICHDEPFYPKFLSREATEILKQLLDKDTSRRLGVTFSPYGEIKDHPFFHYIDWQKIERKEVETPYKPRLRHILDVQYFDPLFTKRCAAITPLEPSILATMDQTAFKEFSYTNPNITD